MKKERGKMKSRFWIAIGDERVIFDESVNTIRYHPQSRPSSERYLETVETRLRMGFNELRG